MIGGKIGSNINFHFLHSNGIPTRKILPSLCKHNILIYLQAVIIGETEYLAVSCRKCNKIRLIDLQNPDQQPVVAYTGKETGPVTDFGDAGGVGPMTTGSPGVLYTVDVMSDNILVFDCTTITFRLVKELPIIEYLKADKMCYSVELKLLFTSSWRKHQICAFTTDGERIWTVRSENNPQGLTYMAEYDKVLCADGYDKTILVIEGRTGELLEKIPLDPDEDVWRIDDVHVKENVVTVQYVANESDQETRQVHLSRNKVGEQSN